MLNEFCREYCSRASIFSSRPLTHFLRLEICLSLDWTIRLNSATSCLSSFTSNSLSLLATLGSHSALNSPAETVAMDGRCLLLQWTVRVFIVVVELVATLRCWVGPCTLFTGQCNQNIQREHRSLLSDRFLYRYTYKQSLH